jgi:plastocyanin
MEMDQHIRFDACPQHGKNCGAAKRSHSLCFVAIFSIGLAASFLAEKMGNATEHRVTAYSSLTFSPASITIYQGDTIRFENGGGPHNVHADDDRFVCSVNCTSDNGPDSTNWSVVVRFDDLGTIGYYCDKHGGTGGGMRGSITVIDRIFVSGFDA